MGGRWALIGKKVQHGRPAYPKDRYFGSLQPMPAPQIRHFTLTPHPAIENPAARGIGGRVSRTPAGLLVSYVLEGDIERLRVPAGQTPRFVDELWRHTCFELFIASKGEPHYYEFNFSPSGEWAAYAFARYRERVPLNPEAALISPCVTVCLSAGKLELDAMVRLDHLSPRHIDSRLVLGLSAVVETHDGSLSYWALKHPLDKPDFHHPNAFVLELDEIRN